MFRPLEGIKVVDLSQVLAGPYATYQLALMGADVIKIEMPDHGDWTRQGGPMPELSQHGMGLGFLALNSEKKSVTLDLKSERGRELARKIVSEADVFLENFKPGVAARLGLGFEEVCALNKNIVYCSVSGYGQDGPWSHRPAYDHVVQGMCGIMLTTGKPGDGPVKVGAPYIDFATGLNAAMAVLAGLMEQRRTGRAVRLDVAMLDSAIAMMGSLVSNHLTAGWKPRQTGNEAWSAAPASGAFDTKDGVLMLAANNAAQFAALCNAIGRADILQDVRWNTDEARKANFDSLRSTLRETFLARTADEWEAVLDAAQVPAGRVRGLDEVLSEDQVRARDLVKEIHVEAIDRSVFVPGLSFKGNGANATPRSAPPVLGADTDEVLRGLGVDQSELEDLRAAGVI